MRAEKLPADLAAVDVVTFAQSFHWMDRARVAAAARTLLPPGGALVHVHATTYPGLDVEDTTTDLTHPRPPWKATNELIRRYLGPQPRAGQSALPTGAGGGETRVYRNAGFTGPEQLTVPGWTVQRSAEQVLAAVHSLSGAAPHLFTTEQLAEFDANLRDLLNAASIDGRFTDQMPGIDVDIWR